MFVQRVLAEYEKLHGNTTREEMHRFKCRISQAYAMGVMTKEEYDEIQLGMRMIRLNGMRADAARLARALENI